MTLSWRILLASTLVILSPLSVPANAAEWARYKSADFSLAPPPAVGSALEAEDFRLLHAYESKRSKADCDLSRLQVHPTFLSLFGKSWGYLSEDEIGLVEPITEKAMQLAERIAGYHKGKFRRPRPYDTDATLTPCGEKPGGARSYPSSHASSATAGACVLALLFPERSEEILAYGSYLGELRAIVGVHHPSDVTAGQSLGQEVCRRLQDDEGFRQDLADTERKLP